MPLSREFLLSRGKCCSNGCTNCPYTMTLTEAYNIVQSMIDAEHSNSIALETVLQHVRPILMERCVEQINKLRKELRDVYTLEFHTYGGGGMAVLVNKDGHYWGRLSVALDIPLPDHNYIWVKTWSENAPWYKHVIEAYPKVFEAVDLKQTLNYDAVALCYKVNKDEYV